MRFDIDLLLRYTYSNGGGIGRNVLRVVPANIDGLQRLVAGSLSIHPKPSERIERIDFFGNTLVEAVFDDAYRELDFSVRARVERFEKPDFVDVSEPVARIADSVRSYPGLDANSPHHFIAPSPRYDDICNSGGRRVGLTSGHAV